MVVVKKGKGRVRKVMRWRCCERLREVWGEDGMGKKPGVGKKV